MKYLTLLLFCFVQVVFSQNIQSYKVHSHNDYTQNIPFWKALAAGASSIEVDVFLKDGQLYVAHEQESISPDFKIKNLYLEPLQKALDLQMLQASQLQMLVDIKSDPYATLNKLIDLLSKFPKLKESSKVSFVISGNRPKIEEYTDYPDFIFFDYQSLETINNPDVLNKVALLSLSFKNFTRWNGKGRLTKTDLARIKEVISKAKTFNKPFRFWATPDSKTSWKALADLGVNYINTDKPLECADYLSTLSNRVYTNTSFSKVYHPTFKTDAKAGKVENVILLIGDGNGLTQLSATLLANNGALSITQLQHIGLLKTQSLDDFTTDSAGAGTAIATGKKVPNRAIGVDENGNKISNITELLGGYGFVTGLITEDKITGATPSAFYAHRQDRDMSKAIEQDLLASKLSLCISATQPKESKWGDFKNVEFNDIGSSDAEKVMAFFAEENDLSSATAQALQNLESREKPFFLMVEGAKIDSYGHANEIRGVINEGIEFDKAVTEALKFADANEKTLVLVTADHETGGLTLPQGNLQKNQIEGDFTTDDHTGVLVPIFAYGPQSESFQGVYDNNLLFHKILVTLGLTNPKKE